MFIMNCSGDILAFYGGYHISCNSHSINYMDKRETCDEDLFNRHMYTLALDVDNLCIDLPPELGTDLNKYNATLGHKVNHSFEPNTEFHIFSVHPVLGTTKMLEAVENINAVTELTVDYGYGTAKSPPKPSWYIKQLQEYLTKKEAEIMKRLPWLGVV